MTLQERLREVGCPGGRYYEVAQEAADALDAKDARIKELEGALRAVIRVKEENGNSSRMADAINRAREALK